MKVTAETDLHKYRPNVAAFLVNSAGQILTCQRRDFPDVWQLPQGGVEPGELEVEALYRELDEELGVKKNEIEVIKQIAEPVYYDWPEEFRYQGYLGQRQIYFLVKYLGPGITLRADAKQDGGYFSEEFVACAWRGVAEFEHLLERELGDERDYEALPAKQRLGINKARAYRNILRACVGEIASFAKIQTII